MKSDTKMYSRLCKALVDGEAWRMPGITFNTMCKKMGIDPAKANERLMKEIGYTGDGLVKCLRKRELCSFLFGTRIETL